MSLPLDYRVRELAHSQPRLRTDLIFVLQEFQGEPSYLMEDPLKRRFFRIGLREYELIRRLNGTQSLGRIVAQLAAHSRKDAFTEQEAATIVRWLADTELLEHADSAHSERLFEHLHVQRQSHSFLQKSSSLLFLKLPIGNPDRLLAALSKGLNWTFSRGFFAVWIIALAAAVMALEPHWSRFVYESQNLVTGNELLVSILVWVALKAIHELWHGLACKRFGLPVPEAGIMLLLLVTPLAYVDATSSLRLRSRAQRMVVSAAGMYIELWLAAILALVWANSEPGLLSTIAHRGVLLGSVTTVLFNANPLMRFDGYYLLSDLVQVPNLYSKGQLCTRYFLQRFLFGNKKAEMPLDPHENFSFIACYGLAAAIWRVLMFISILLAAAFLLKDVGLLLAIFVCLTAAWNNLQVWGQSIASAAHANHQGIWKTLKRPALVIAGIFLLLLCWQVRESATAAAVVEYQNSSIVRTECPGFVRSIHVQSGQYVHNGDLLLELENPEVIAELSQLRADLARSLVQMEILFREGNLAGSQAENENATGLRARIAELEAFAATLTVKAPRDGVVESRELANLLGAYLRVGQEILMVAQPGVYKLTAAIPQDRIEVFRSNPKASVDFLIDGRFGAFEASLDKLEAAATRDLPHPALAASLGGPLNVESRPEKSRPDLPTNRGASNFRLVKPHFKATLSIAAPPRLELHEGELASIKIHSSQRRSLATLIRDSVLRFFGQKLERLRATPEL